MPLSSQAIESVAPDQASLGAARKIKRSAWSTIGIDAAGHIAWGECQGSGSSPYRVSLDIGDLGAKCSCPSRKFPCKHALALMVVLLEHPDASTSGQAPDWVTDWLARRRPGKSGKPSEEGAATEAKSLASAKATEPIVDEKAAARAAAQRERLKAQREVSIRGGLDDLDIWIGDQIGTGLATFAQRAPQQCRLAAQRLVDAKAPGLATRLDSLPSELLAMPEVERAPAAIESLGFLHLLAEAYRRETVLPEMLRADVRRLVGWTTERQELLDDASALRITSTWTVLAVHSEIQPDKLRRIETWLMSTDICFAVLIDYVPVASGQGGSAFWPGEAFEAELVYYPSVAPLRAVIARRGAEAALAWPAPRASLRNALADYDALAAKFPWVSAWPFFICGTRLTAFEGNGLWLIDGDEAVPVVTRQFDAALALAAASISSLAGLWDGRGATILAAETSLGSWWGGRP